LSSNPEDIMQLPAPKPKPLPSIPPLPRCRGRMNLEKQDEVIKCQVEPEDIFKTYGANVVKPLASGMKIERREQSTESDYRNEPSNTAEDVAAKIVQGRASTGSMIDAKTNVINGVPSTIRAPPASEGPARIGHVGKLTLEQIHRIVSLHKKSNEPDLELDALLNEVGTGSLEQKRSPPNGSKSGNKNGAPKQTSTFSSGTPVCSSKKTSSSEKLGEVSPPKSNAAHTASGSSNNTRRTVPKSTPMQSMQSATAPKAEQEFIFMRIKSEPEDDLDYDSVSSAMLTPEVTLKQEPEDPPQKISPNLKVKEEPKEIDPNTRRSKRTSAIFRPNAADMLKGIVRKVGAKPESSSQPQDLEGEDLIYARPGKMIKTK
jgi:hypothetical protein